MPGQPEALATAAPPTGLELRRRGDMLIVRAPFPSTIHLVEAVLAGLLLTSGFALAGSARQVARLAFPGSPLALPALVTAAAVVAIFGVRRLRRNHPYALHLDTQRLTLVPPFGSVSLGARAQPISRRHVALREIAATELGPDGLHLHLFSHPLGSARPSDPVVPWRYGRNLALWSTAGGQPVTAPAFRVADLIWLKGLLDALRAGDPTALFELRGGNHAEVAGHDEEAWVLPGLSPARLQVLVALLAATLAWWHRAGPM